MMHISSSGYATAMTCPRLWYFKYVLRLERTRRDGARGFGTMYHAGLAAWWSSMDGGDVPWRDADEALVLALRAIHESSTHIDTDPFDTARAEAMMTVYHARNFELHFESVEPGKSGVEEAFDIELLDPEGRAVPGWRVVGKKDAFKRFLDGVKVVEHKQTSQEIHGTSDYWTRLRIDTQVSIYIDAGQRLGHNVDAALYDASRRPGILPKLKTPDEKKRITKGQGCPHCGGRKGGKGGALKGSGHIMTRTKVDGDGRPLPAPIDVQLTCTACDGTGWYEAPRLDARQRDEDETPEDFKQRCLEEIDDDVDKHFRMGTIRRSREDIEESRADLVFTTATITAMLTYAQKVSTSPRDVAARRCFPRNDGACTNQYGRRCDFIDVCSGAVDPYQSPLYQVRAKKVEA